MNSLGAAMLALVDGDLTGLPTVLGARHQDLVETAGRLPKLTVYREALARVLRSWLDGLWAPDDVQKWSSFMRRGYVAGNLVRGYPTIDIKYDERDEDLIVEIMSRFDEIGDLIDGSIDQNELHEMLGSLEAHQSSPSVRG